MELLALLLDELLPLSALVEHFLTSLDLFGKSFTVTEFVDTEPEGILISAHLLNWFGFNNFLDLYDVLSSVLLAPEDEIVKLLSRPIRKPTGHQLLNFLPFLRCKATLIQFWVLMVFFFLGMTAELFAEFLLSEVVFLFLHQCLQTFTVLVKVMFL